jgi:hypothetical protein
LAIPLTSMATNTMMRLSSQHPMHDTTHP